jgi:cutinase
MISTIASLTDRNGLLDAGVEPHIRNEIIDRAPCGKVTFIFARASSEVPNMVTRFSSISYQFLLMIQGGSMGPIICNGLKKKYGDKSVLCQGVGNGYTASITDNIGGVGTSRAAIAEATKMFTMAASQCPDAIITFGGYRSVSF